MSKWSYLIESDAKERELLRIIHANPGDEKTRQALKTHRIRTHQARRFDKVVALPSEGGLNNKWVAIGRWEPAIDGERFEEYGYDTERWEFPYIIGEGSGFLTFFNLVYARNDSDAYAAAEEQWPNEFVTQENGNSHGPEYEPEIRVISRCSTWEIGRNSGVYIELLDGRLVKAI
jgi:hypothetical protein